jgi:REP element-mobilizing transposase RayT
MATHRLHIGKDAFYFVTFACYKWLPLINKTNLYDYLPAWSDKLSIRGIKNCGYVAMPNHLHFIFYVENESEGLNKMLGEGKRFMAYEIVKRLQKQKEYSVLKVLEEGVQQNEKIKGKNHQVFRLSFDAKPLNGIDQINNTLDYIHHNPVNGKWNLVDDYTKYPYSSAAYYELGIKSTINIHDFRRWFSESSIE